MADERRLKRIVQPHQHFFDQQRLPRSIGADDVEVSEWCMDVTSSLPEMAQRQRCASNA